MNHIFFFPSMTNIAVGTVKFVGILVKKEANRAHVAFLPAGARLSTTVHFLATLQTQQKESSFYQRVVIPGVSFHCFFMR